MYKFYGRSFRLWLGMAIMGLVGGCSAGKDNNMANQLRTNISQGKVAEAIAITEQRDFYAENRDKLLQQLERGTVRYIHGDYYQALQWFDKAKATSEELYTKSISNSTKANLLNENLRAYYGEDYERSMINFYLALVHYNLYRQGKYESHQLTQDNGKVVEVPEKILTAAEKRNHLMGARASIVTWNSMLEGMSREHGGKAIYKDDLTAKLLGATIHEIYGTSNDRQIALQLYRDARNVVLKNYNLYPTFNLKSDEFMANFGSFNDADMAKIQAQYVESTIHATELLNWIDHKITALEQRKSDNVNVIVQEGFIANKQAHKVKFNIPNEVLLPACAVDSNLCAFMALAMGAGNAINFEIPSMAKPTTAEGYRVVFLSKDGVVLQEKPLVIINPLSDIAYSTLTGKQPKIIAAKGMRLAAKVILALTAANQVSHQFGIVVQMMAATSAMAMALRTETADLRSWMTMPNSIRMSSVALPAGDYVIQVQDAKSKVITSRELQLLDNQPIIVDLDIQ